MIHEIYPKKYRVEYYNNKPEPCDTLFLFDGDQICCRLDGNEAVFPRFTEFSDINDTDFRYLFSIDDERFFTPDICAADPIRPPEGYGWQNVASFRTAGPRHLAFAAVTAHDLYLWYSQNKYCGRCGAENRHAESERTCVCTKCGLTEYPRISPVVIVGVTNGENLLVTRYKDRPYRRYALVAGFAEIGEALEDTVRREVFEETGIHVKNIKYYRSQPWAFTSTLLSGFYCELDGDPEIRVDEDELAEAIWLPRGDIPASDIDIALTAEMMEMFRTGKV